MRIILILINELLYDSVVCDYRNSSIQGVRRQASGMSQSVEGGSETYRTLVVIIEANLSQAISANKISEFPAIYTFFRKNEVGKSHSLIIRALSTKTIFLNLY